MSRSKYDAFISRDNKSRDSVEEFEIDNWLEIILSGEGNLQSTILDYQDMTLNSISINLDIAIKSV